MSIGFKFNDWFGRDEKHGYTNYDINKRTINWDEGLDDYSDFFFGRNFMQTGLVDTKLIESAASLLSTMSKVVGINQEDFTYVRDKNKIHLPTDLLKTANLDVFLGASLQNMTHNIYSSEPQRNTESKIVRSGKPIEAFIFNVMNMERINNLMSQDTPGYLNFIAKYKDHQYQSRKPLAEDASEKMKFMELFDRIIRYPSKISDDEIKHFEDLISQIKDLIKKNKGIPDDFSKCKNLSFKIANIIESYFEEEDKEKDKEENKEEDKKDEENDEKKDDKKETKPDTPKDLELNQLLKDLIESSKPTETGSVELFEELIDEMKTAADVSSSHEALKNLEYIYPKSNSITIRNYQNDLKKIDIVKANVIANLLKRKSRDYKFILKSMRSGRLDTNKLAEAKQMVPTIYEKMGEVKTNKLCVGILVDESGSMAGSKADAARQAAIFLNEALKKVKDVELFIYGHTADWTQIDQGVKGGKGYTQLFVYKELGYQNDQALGYISGKWENRDGYAMLAAAKRIRSKTMNNGIFICISDGSPHAHKYSGSEATKHVRTVANSIEQMGFEVIQVTIGGYRSLDMFKNVVNIDNATEFPTKFVKFLKTKINSLIKEKIKL